MPRPEVKEVKKSSVASDLLHVEEQKKEKNTNDKYKLLLRIDGALEEAVRSAAADMGLPVTRYIEIAIRERLKADNKL